MTQASSPISLEQPQRLSRSLLWQLQRTFFRRESIDAWRKGIVPHYVTSNPFIAAAYARIVTAFLRDWGRSAGAGPDAAVDHTQPIYLVELGAGSGRFAYAFLRHFLELRRRFGSRDLGPRCVMTDLPDENVAFWRAHPRLQAWVERAVLDCARFDVENDREVRLLVSGATLAEGTVRNPVIVLANYFFDGVPQDTFLVREGQLYENLVTLCSTQEEPDLGDPALLSRARLAYEHRPTSADYYGDPDWDRILNAYQQRLGATAIRFPVAALECCRQLARPAGGRLLLLSSDKGYLREQSLSELGPPTMAVHGSFSMNVNYHAIGEYFRNQGGEVLRAPQPHAHLAVAAFLLGAPAGGYEETRRAFAESVEEFGPDEFFTLKQRLERSTESLSLDEVLAIVRLSRWDHRTLREHL